MYLNFHSKFSISAFLLIAFACLPAVESNPVAAIAILNGRQIGVEADLGGVKVTTPVTLRYLSLMDGDDSSPSGAACQYLKRTLPMGSKVILSIDNQPSDQAQSGTLEAIVCQDFLPTDAERAKDPNLLSKRTCLQIEMIKAGVARYWTEGGRAPDPLHEALLQAQKEAKDARRGGWAELKEVEPKPMGSAP